MLPKITLNGGQNLKIYINWRTVYARLNKWNKNRVLKCEFEGLQTEGVIEVKASDAFGALNRGNQQKSLGEFIG